MNRAREFLWIVLALPLARLVVGIAGLAGVAAGAWIAWRADAATLLLVVAAVLVALSLFDWTELTARHGESSLTLKRTRMQIQEVAEREDVPEQAREQLQEAAHSIDLVTTTATTSLGSARDALVRMVMVRPDAKLDRVGEKLAATFEPRTVYTMAGPSVRCGISDPMGKRTFSDDRPWGSITLTYPDEFEGAAGFMAGEYVAEWFQYFPWESTLSKIAEARYRMP